jgi:hypothetical protein
MYLLPHPCLSPCSFGNIHSEYGDILLAVRVIQLERHFGARLVPRGVITLRIEMTCPPTILAYNRMEIFGTSLGSQAPARLLPDGNFAAWAIAHYGCDLIVFTKLVSLCELPEQSGT